LLLLLLFYSLLLPARVLASILHQYKEMMLTHFSCIRIVLAANSIVLEDVYHADVLPNPVGGRNAKLIGCSWYADKLDEWIDAL
jgi:hypothetical protein